MTSLGRLASTMLLLAVPFSMSACCLPTRLAFGIRLKPDPLWKTDLRPLGFYVDDLSPPGTITANNQIAFGSDGELVVISEQKVRSKEPNPVRAYVLDATTGHVVKQVSWTSKSWPYIFATSSGRYLVNTSEGLQLFSAGLEEILGRHEDNTDWSSPDGRTIVVRGGVPGRAVTTFLDTDTLLPTGAEFINEHIDSIAFNRIVNTGYRNGSSHASVFIEDATGSIAPLDTECDEVRPRFISQDVLAVFGCDRMTVVSVQGNVLLTTGISDAGRWVAPASRNGRRFAVISTYESAAHWPKTCFERVEVYDVETSDVIFRAELRGCGGSPGGSGIALSPEGRLLAVNSLGVVQMFSLPALPERSE